MEKIKPCPFCGKTPENVLPEQDFFEVNSVRGYYVMCPNYDCDIQPMTELFGSEQDAIIAWNKRKGEENEY